MNPMLVLTIVELIAKLMPTVEKIVDGTLKKEEVDWNSLLIDDDFMERAEAIRKEKEKEKSESPEEN